MTHFYRNRSARAVHEMQMGPNMTPMVDVVMVILIFFMASAAILGPEWFIKTALPVMAAGGKSEAVETRLRLELHAEGGTTQVDLIPADRTKARRVAIRDVEVELAREYKAADGELLVLVAPDPGVQYDHVVRVHEACARVGILKVGIVDAK